MITVHIPRIENPVLQLQIQTKIDQKTKPTGALGQLEALALQMAMIQQTTAPELQRPAILVFAGDHGIAEEGVSAYPQAVTAQMVYNFLSGGAGVNVFARQHGFALTIVDSGVNHVFAPHANLIDAKIGMGTANFLYFPAMSLEACQLALAKGADIVRAQVAQGSRVIAFGEMGISNTASASCLMSVLTHLPLHQCVGRGTGLDARGVEHKLSVLTTALSTHHIDMDDPLQVLATYGGYEIAMMVGAMLAAAEARCVLLIDGFIATAALLVAHKHTPAVLDYCVFAHCSGEQGHRILLQYLKVQPLLDLGLRLGEGTGAVLAYPLLQSAVAFLNEMASFESAGVSAQRES